jgi:hypothetical protein
MLTLQAQFYEPLRTVIDSTRVLRNLYAYRALAKPSHRREDVEGAARPKRPTVTAYNFRRVNHRGLLPTPVKQLASYCTEVRYCRWPRSAWDAKRTHVQGAQNTRRLAPMARLCHERVQRPDEDGTLFAPHPAA